MKSEYSLDFSFVRKYTVERLTVRMKVPYFVKENFHLEYQGSTARLDASVEEEYVTNLKHACYRERNYSEYSNQLSLSTYIRILMVFVRSNFRGFDDGESTQFRWSWYDETGIATGNTVMWSVSDVTKQMKSCAIEIIITLCLGITKKIIIMLERICFCTFSIANESFFQWDCSLSSWNLWFTFFTHTILAICYTVFFLLMWM